MPSTTRSLSLGVLLLAAGCSASAGPTAGSSPSPGTSPTTEGPVASGQGVDTVCSLPRQWVQRIHNGYGAGRSGEIEILPQVPNFVGAGLPHVGPWDFTSDVPLFWYGPGYIKPVGPVQQPVDLPDIAATYAHLLGSAFQAPDGQPMLDGLVPAADRSEPPRLIVNMIWDGAGRDVLDQWPDAWPNLERLRPQGAWYEHATVGSSPTSSAQIHGAIGTGAYPRNHGLVGHSFRIGGGSEIYSPWKDGPSFEELTLPTFGDLYDAENGNRPLVGLSGTVPIQLGMMSHGTASEGGDRDLAVLRVPGKASTLGAEGVLWNLPEGWDRWYEYPAYANDSPPVTAYFDDVDLDAGDGKRDGLWHGHPFESDELLGGFHTPARVPYQTNLIEEMIRREGFGDDEVTDLFFINYKLIDTLGHLYGIDGPEMEDAVAAQDASLAAFIDFLNREVGRERWILLLTADHGSLMSTKATGAFQISAERLHASIEERFDENEDDVPVIEQVKQTEIFMNSEELAEQGYTLQDVAEFIMTLRQEDVPIPGLPVPDPTAKVFRAAFPSELLDQRLPCLEES